MRKCNLQCATILICLLVFFAPSLQSDSGDDRVPIPTPWPHQFHALLYKNLSVSELQITHQYYDWKNGRNVNIMQMQLGALKYSVEWNNGTSFYYTLGKNGICNVVDFGVGIPRPDFLDGANYLGTVTVDGFLCNLWEKLDFIWYYEDVVTKRPVRWDFSEGYSIHVFTFDVGVVIQDKVVQAPAYWFNKTTTEELGIFKGDLKKYQKHKAL